MVRTAVMPRFIRRRSLIPKYEIVSASLRITPAMLFNFVPRRSDRQLGHVQTSSLFGTDRSLNITCSPDNVSTTTSLTKLSVLLGRRSLDLLGERDSPTPMHSIVDRTELTREDLSSQVINSSARYKSATNARCANL